MCLAGPAVRGPDQPEGGDLAREERRVRLLKALHTRLFLIEKMLPAAPEELDLEDFKTHPEGVTGLRISVQGLLRDHVEPLLRALLAVVDEKS